jgi:hypothetical protein
MRSTPAVQLHRLRQMTADEKVRLSHALWVETWHALAAGVEASHPDWPRERVRDRVRELIRGASA